MARGLASTIQIEHLLSIPVGSPIGSPGQLLKKVYLLRRQLAGAGLHPVDLGDRVLGGADPG
jgi:hypothetical protein